MTVGLRDEGSEFFNKIHAREHQMRSTTTIMIEAKEEFEQLRHAS